jgi:hypothetical protein
MEKRVICYISTVRLYYVVFKIIIQISIKNFFLDVLERQSYNETINIEIPYLNLYLLTREHVAVPLEDSVIFA